MEKDKLLIIEDDEDLRRQMKWGLAQDYEILLAEDRQSAMEICKKENPPVMTLDLGLPPESAGVAEGFAVLQEILAHDRFSKVIIITGRSEKEHALTSIGHGAYDFLVKPIELNELRVILRRAFHLSKLESENLELQEVDPPSGVLEGFLPLTDLGRPVTDDTVLVVKDGDLITATYIDDTLDEFGNPLIATDQASIDCEPPQLLGQEPAGVTESSAGLIIETDEP